MAYFKKKPVVIEARQFVSNNELEDVNMNELVDWVNHSGGEAFHDGTSIYIETLEGRHRADVRDWIIKGIKGEFYPCKQDIFANSYDLASAEDLT